MTKARGPDYAVVRGVPATYEMCIASHAQGKPVDLSLARRQHGSYCETLRSLGLELIRVAPDDRFPDCCFVEDPAIVAGEAAVIARMAVQSRVGEEAAVRETLRPFRQIREILSPGTLEGGDVLQIDDKMYVGLTKRTNRAGLEQLDAFVSEFGFEVIPVAVTRGLHLKSSCTYLGNGSVVLVPGCLDEGVFSEYNVIEITAAEAPAADCLRISDLVLVLEGYPTSRREIEAAGFETRAIEMSEFEKCAGALTCLSIVF